MSGVKKPKQSSGPRKLISITILQINDGDPQAHNRTGDD